METFKLEWDKFFNSSKELISTIIDLDYVSTYIDQNIATFRYVPYALGTAGIFVAFRGIRLASKFTDASRVPRSFLRKNVELRGKVENVNLDGTLDINHTPILRMPWHSFNEGKFLTARLAYVSPTVSGVYWMKLNVVGKPVKLRLFDRQNNELLVNLKTSLPKRSNFSLNETLVRNGQAQLMINQVSIGKNRKIQEKLMKNLKNCESYAKKEGHGMWEGNVPETWTKKLLGKTTSILKSMFFKN